MPTINLGKQNLYIVDFSIVCVKKEQYSNCKLFRRYTHTLSEAKSGNIFVFNSANGSGKYLTIRNKSEKLQKVDVYFNQYDTSNTPLLFVLFIANGVHEQVKNKYHPRSKFDNEIASCTTKKIQELCNYANDESILCALIQENDTLKELLTYDIMRRPNGNGGPCKYNCGKIQVELEKNGQPPLTGNGFKRFKHTPNNGANGGHKDKKACVVYNCQALLKEGGTEELENVQGQKYESVKVYFGQKAKRPCTTKGAGPQGVCACPPGAKGDTCTKGEGGTSNTCPPATSASPGSCPAAPTTAGCQDVPLMLELHKPTSNGHSTTNNPDYYVHRRQKNGRTGSNGDQYYWVKLTLENGREGQNGLKQLLSEIGLSEHQEGNGTNVREQLNKPANGADGTGDSNGPTYLDLLLKRLEFDLTNSVVILMDKRNGPGGGYGDGDITGAIKNLQSGGQTGINPLKLNGDGKKITVTDSANGLCKCLTDYKYRVVQHDFQNAVSKLTSGCSAGLRFLMPTRDGNAVDGGGNGTKYAQLKLYSTDTKAANLQYIYYTNNGDHNCAKVYVVFYKGDGNGGTESDPRPLLLCYNKEVYRATSKEGYDAQQWVKVTGLDSLKKCLCNNGVDAANGGQDEPLLKAVTEVVGFLNQVNLYQHPGTSTSAEGQACATQPGVPAATQCQSDQTTSTNTCTYAVHTYNGKQVNVEVTCCPVNANGSNCYRKLTHKPIGTNGSSGAANGSGFRLGDIIHTSDRSKLDYYSNGGNIATNKYNPLVKVHSYFYNDDTKYCDPLLVVLEFAKVNGLDSSNANKEYYKLTSANGNSLTWAKDEQACKTVLDDGAQLVKHLDGIRYCLKYTIRIHLECKTSYQLKGRNGSQGTGGFSQPIKNNGDGNGKVKVTVCEVKCDALTTSNYKCFRHKLGEALNGKQHEVAGLAFTLPCENGAAGQSACCVNGVTSGVANGFVEIPVCVPEGQCDKCQTNGQCEVKCADPAAQVQCPASPSTAATCPPKPGTIPPILYNKCMGDVYVYFYACKNGGTESCGVSTDTTVSGSCSTADVKTDTVPLMVRFNGNFYRPCDRDSYFTKWVCVSTLAGVACKSGCKCCCCGANADGGTDCTAQCSKDCDKDCDCCTQLVEALNKVNADLNRIDLDKSRLVNGAGGSNGKGYGLPENGSGGLTGTKLADSVCNYRICLTKQQPKDSDGKEVYTRVVHRTKNGFRIGCITYCGHEIVACGITPKGQDAKNGGACTPGSSVGAACPATSSSTSSDCTIKVANGSSQKHTALVSSNSWNTVAAYYSKTDECYRLPQLIVILKTNGEVKNGSTVTGSASTPYGYYVLATQSGGGGVSSGSGYQYRWVNVNGKDPPATQVKLDEKTDFSLLNAAIILLERRVTGTSGGSCTYGEGEIKKAVASAAKQKPDLKSPGNKDDVNRLKDKTITVKDETSTGDGTSSGVCCCKCLTDTGFKVMSHDLTPLVKLNGKFTTTLSEVKLIAGLKLLIPTSTKVVYKQVKLVDNGTAAETGAPNGLVKYHKNGNNKICVYFYDRDPRPLLVCYDNWAYAPKSMKDYDDQKWTQCKEAAECKCAQQPPGTCEKCKLLAELIRVSDFLNPVYINIVSKCPKYYKYYFVQEFNGQRFWILVTAKPACGSFCFDRFTHKHYGIGCGGTGFRLGDIHYKQNCIKENGSSSNTGANGKCISASDIDDTSNKHRASPEVVVFYYRGDKDRRNPLLVALKSHDQGTNGKYKPYFELQKKFDQGQPKLYKKNDNGDGLDLRDTNPNGQLAKTLDAILYRISKYLRVVLSQRPVPRDYKASSDKNGHITDVFKAKGEKTPSDKDPGKQLFDVNVKMLEKMAESADEAAKKGKPSYTTRDALMHHVLRETKYQAQLCDNGPSGSPPSSPPTDPKETTITVKEVDCPEIHSQGGYRCFKHDLVNTEHIEQVGGLKLYLWADGKGTQGGAGTQEITLCTGQTTSNGQPCKNGKTGQPVELSYTTCKGDLYVFFYGEDPRPLMLCYDGHAYCPRDMESYCREWVRLNNGANGAKNGQGTPVDCLCQDAGGGGQKPKFNSQQLLNALYRVSVFMNPVKLCLSCEAIKQLRPKRPDQQPDGPGQEQTCPSGTNGSSSASGSSPDDYTYLTHNYPPDPVKVRVTTRDLNCYRRYTHKTAREGFRLGKVTYAEAKGDGDAGAKATGSQCADAVSTASTTTTTACSASGTPTTTSNNEPFCFEYDCSKQLWSVCVYYYMYDKDHKWPLVVELGFRGQSSEFYRLCSKPDSASNGQTGSNGNNGAQGANGDTQTANGACKDKKLKWVRMSGEGEKGPKSDSCKNGPGSTSSHNGQNGDCKPCNNSNSTQATQNNGGETPEDRKRMCQEDAEFARRAREIHDAIHSDKSPSSVFLGDRVPMERELTDLVERRAYEVRKHLQINYGEKTEDKLILATASNCWEGWPLDYMVGGGFLGVAGGGGWKVLMTMVGFFVKL